MKRRVSTLLGAAVLPRPARAQLGRDSRRVGALFGVGNDAQGQRWASAFIQALEVLNWRPGDNIVIEWRWGGGDHARIERYATELVRCDLG